MSEDSSPAKSSSEPAAPTESSGTVEKRALDAVTALADFAKSEISWVRTAYKFGISFVGTVVTVGVGLGIWFTYKSASDFKSETRQDIDREKQELHERLSTYKSEVTSELSKDVEGVRKQVEARVNQEFEREHISRLVESNAQVRIDQIADKLIREQVAKQITPLKDELTQLINSSVEAQRESITRLDAKTEQSQKTEESMHEVLNEARKTLNQVEVQSKFIMTVMAAQNDDRSAYATIHKWANDSSYPLRMDAARTEMMISRDYVGWQGEKPYLEMPWKEGVDPQEMTLDEIQRMWNSLPSNLAQAFVVFVWDHKKLTKEEKHMFMHKVLSDSRNSLQAADKAARIMAGEAKVKYNPPFHFSEIEKWYETRSFSNAVSTLGTNFTVAPASTNAVPKKE